MIKEIQARTILSTCKNPSGWFGTLYSMNIYRGCTFKCIYCDSRSECYRIENFDDIYVKVNAVELLKKELPRKRKKGTIGTGAMSDPYNPAEKEYRLTRKALETIAEARYPVHITTKSTLVTRDVDVLMEIGKIYASVAITITTTDDSLAAKIEPNAPPPSERLKAIGILSALGITTGITMMPILPFIEDSEENITEIVKAAKEFGASYIYPCIGVTMRDRQRDYFYSELDKNFPGIRSKYEKRFGIRYGCFPSNSKKLMECFREACKNYGVSTDIPTYGSKISGYQLSLFDM